MISLTVELSAATKIFAFCKPYLNNSYNIFPILKLIYRIYYRYTPAQGGILVKRRL